MAPNPTQESDNERRLQLRGEIEKAVFAYARMPAATALDAESFLHLVDATRIAGEECAALQRSVVHQARRADNAWAAIGDRLGITRQAAQQRFAPESADQGNATGTRQVTGATAFNEMRRLEEEGAAGYHLVGFGPLFLTLQASDQPWEHRREVALNIEGKRARLEKAGWRYIGAWFPFHYFKRPR
jgi:hypothetical protein